MRKLVLIAAMLMASASAHAGNFSFNVEGQTVQVQIPRGCSSLSCINITAPGLSDKFKEKEDTSTTSTPAPTATAPAQAPVAAPAPAPQAVATAPAAETPAPGTSSKVTVLPPPTQNTAAPVVSVPPLTAPQASVQPAPAPVAAPAPAPTQVAAIPAPAPAPTPTAAANSPIGVWLTEKKEGKIRIVECGANLCGYDVKKDGSNGSQILHNMKPGGEKWNGRITDTRSGSSYTSNIALRGSDKLRVQGCMMGFCGGETWTRVE
jgi:uncharacterized protein (DUF2147 family)